MVEMWENLMVARWVDGLAELLVGGSAARTAVW